MMGWIDLNASTQILGEIFFFLLIQMIQVPVQTHDANTMSFDLTSNEEREDDEKTALLHGTCKRCFSPSVCSIHDRLLIDLYQFRFPTDEFRDTPFVRTRNKRFLFSRFPAFGVN